MSLHHTNRCRPPHYILSGAARPPARHQRESSIYQTPHTGPCRMFAYVGRPCQPAPESPRNIALSMSSTIAARMSRWMASARPGNRAASSRAVHKMQRPACRLRLSHANRERPGGGGFGDAPLLGDSARSGHRVGRDPRLYGREGDSQPHGGAIVKHAVKPCSLIFLCVSRYGCALLRYSPGSPAENPTPVCPGRRSTPLRPRSPRAWRRWPQCTFRIWRSP